MSEVEVERAIQTAQTGPQQIGKGRTPETGGRIELEVHVPYDARVIAIRALIKNVPWGEGQCALRPDGWVVAPLNGTEPMGWCRATGLGQGTGAGFKWFKVRFESWSHCNSRLAQLEVDYEMPRGASDDTRSLVQIEESLWKVPYSNC